MLVAGLASIVLDRAGPAEVAQFCTALVGGEVAVTLLPVDPDPRLTSQPRSR
ncbi:hypothetical protein [Actinoplanes sp. TFC3]|uniref:hypothetical protein n=1 Tax=Actinoplanes sp. TFC3 TaxID=1710355 RepID=UPI000ADF2884|nr:hypothetical protein [Actinoplanes sp. TFC3]